jgi:hypothetical protein
MQVAGTQEENNTKVLCFIETLGNLVTNFIWSPKILFHDLFMTYHASELYETKNGGKLRKELSDLWIVIDYLVTKRVRILLHRYVKKWRI